MKNIALITNGGNYNHHLNLTDYLELSFSGWERVYVNAEEARNVSIFTSMEEFLIQSDEFLSQLNKISILSRKTGHGGKNQDGFENDSEICQKIKIFLQEKFGYSRDEILWLVQMYGNPNFCNETDQVKKFAF